MSNPEMPRRRCPYSLTLLLALVALGSFAPARPALGCVAPAPAQAVWPRGAYPLYEINLPSGEGTPRNVVPTVVLPPHRPLRPVERAETPPGRKLTPQEAWRRGRFSEQELSMLDEDLHSQGWDFCEREWASRFATAELTLQLRGDRGARVAGRLRASADPPPRCRRAPICVVDDLHDRSCRPFPCGERWLAFEPAALLPPGRYELVLATRDNRLSSVVSRFAVGDAVDRTPPRLDSARAAVFEPVMIPSYYSYPDGFAAHGRQIVIDLVQESGEYSGRLAVWLAGDGEAIDYARPPTTYVARPNCTWAWTFGWSFTDPFTPARMGVRLVDSAGNLSEPVELELDVARPREVRFFRLWGRGHYFHPGSWPPQWRLPALLALWMLLGLMVLALRRARQRPLAGMESIIADAGVESVAPGEAAAFSQLTRRWRRARWIGALGRLTLLTAAAVGLLVITHWDGHVRRVDLAFLAQLDAIPLCGVAAMLGALVVDCVWARRLRRRFQRCRRVFEHLSG